MGEEPKRNPNQGEPFQMDFSAFILSLNASALIHLGEIPDPQSRERTVNLPSAKYTIEILEIIKDKTTGNLESEEERLLNDILFNLRMKYVKNTGSEKK